MEEDLKGPTSGLTTEAGGEVELNKRLDRIEQMLLALIRMQGAATGALNPRARTQEQMQADTDEANKRAREEEAKLKAELDKPFEENPIVASLGPASGLIPTAEQEVENKENPLDKPQSPL